MYNNLDQIFADAGTHQVTAQELLNGRTHVRGEWQAITLTDELREQIISKVAETAGGRERTKVRVYNRLRFERPQHWAIARFLLSKYGDSPAHLSYCAGQDQTWEMKALREYLK